MADLDMPQDWVDWTNAREIVLEFKFAGVL